MQYILSESEMTDYREALKRLRKLPTEEELQALCTTLAMKAPAYRPWNPRITAPWGCKLIEGSIPYCDNCPVKTICPHENKRYSK